MLSTAAIARAFESLRSGFEADGVHIQVAGAHDDTVTVELLCSKTTCRDCLMPVPHLQRLFHQALADNGISVRTVHVTIVDG